MKLCSAAPLLGLLLSAPHPAAGAADPPDSGGRVVVLGFDGADFRTTQRLMRDGQLPNLQRLSEEGTFAPLVSTNPAESAAGWAALNTGVNPARNGVPSFIRRNLALMSPDTGHLTISEVGIDELEPRGLLGILARWGGVGLTLGAGAVVCVGFAVFFAFVLRMRKFLAVPLALAFGAVGGYAVHVAEGYVPSSIPSVYKSAVEVDGFWAHAARAGVPSIVLDAALAFGQPTVEGARVLGGLGLPDVRGALSGDWFIYTTDDIEVERAPKGASAGSTGSGTVFRVDERSGRIRSQLYGPVDFWQRDKLVREHGALEQRLEQDTNFGWKESGELRERKEELAKVLDEFGYRIEGRRPKSSRALYKHRTSVPLEIERRDGKALVTVDGATQKVGVGEWSDWFRLTFDINPLIQVRGITRCRVMSLEDPFEVYFNSLEIDPTAPPFWQPVSQPVGFSKQLVEWSGGLFETLGWSCMTNQIKDKRLDPKVFLEDIEFTLRWRERVTLRALERGDWRLLFSVFSTPDRVQHMMYRYWDEGHPRHDAAKAAEEVVLFGEKVTLGEVIPAVYREMDRVVGEVLARLGEGDTLMLCADHGFTSYRRGMEVNNWLVERGYLVLREGLTSTRANQSGIAFAANWDRTQAYSLGLGMVYLNLVGREENGIVEMGEAMEVLRRIEADFLEATDPGPEDAPFAEPRKVGLDATIMPELYPSADWGTDEYACADLMLGFG